VLRVGWGVDVHAFGGTRSLVLGGCPIPGAPAVEATSDGDVVAHSVTDALLGAANLGDMGTHFPSSEHRFDGADSLDLLTRAVSLAAGAGVRPVFVDVTIVVQSVRIAPHRTAIRQGLARALGLGDSAVSVKATTTDRLGFIGRDEGIAAVAVLTAEATA
jgi:2-C-methyl-D-erythritol 4-phosphate cytidylyltransferase/2-C-methyl-D-erythritol 2,4-cyclodiphosphate synthase